MTTKEGIALALKAVGVMGLAGVTVVSPNASGAFARLLDDSLPDEPLRKRVFAELKRQKLIQIDTEQENIRITITPSGAYRLLALGADEVEIPYMKKWDNRWRLVCFDIPKGKNNERSYFNRRLHELNFTMIQKSMWVHPFECFDQIRIVTDYANLSRYVSVMEITKLDEVTTKRLMGIYGQLLH